MKFREKLLHRKSHLEKAVKLKGKDVFEHVEKEIVKVLKLNLNCEQHCEKRNTKLVQLKLSPGLDIQSHFSVIEVRKLEREVSKSNSQLINHKPETLK